MLGANVNGNGMERLYYVRINLYYMRIFIDWDFDQAIMSYVRKNHSLFIDWDLTYVRIKRS